MVNGALELGGFNYILGLLSKGIERYHQEITDTQIRDGLIQRFEFSYEISHKMLKRHLELTSPNPTNVDSLAFQDLIRTGSEQGLLLNDWSRWKLYREMRSKTSHAYDEQVALEVVSHIPGFLHEAIYLRDALMAKQAG
jgi:nucleotidyltransferase substrate binding protein (TIGR01987 family)